MNIFAGVVKFFSYTFFLAYIVLFIPALIYIAPLGLFILDRDGVGTIAAISCLVATASIPLSMAVSIYFMIKYSKLPLQMFFSACLPFGAAVFALVWAHLTSWICGS